MRAGLPVARVPQGLKAHKGPPVRMVRKALKVPPVQRVPRVHKVRKAIPGHKGRRGLMAPMGPGCQLVGPARKC